MPISGGAADKKGNQYENYWAIQSMVRILLNDVKSITIEPVNMDKTDFILQFESKKTEAWQIKRQTSYNFWTLSELNSKGIFSFFKDQYHYGNIGILASISDSPDLREILERAEQADSWEIFESLIKKNKDINRTFENISSLLAEQNPTEVLAILKNSRLTCSDHKQLLDLIDCSLRLIFREQQPSKIRSILFEYYFDQIHKTLEADDIFEHLKSKGIYSTEEHRNTVKLTIKNISTQYTNYQKRRLILGQLIHRDITNQIIDTILKASESVNIVILGEAGSGKSGVLYETLQLLNQKEIPVLAFRMDQLKYKTFSLT
jgi:ABC-type glutathione transport system ATPase component